MHIPKFIKKNKKIYLAVWFAVFSAFFTISSIIGIFPEAQEKAEAQNLVSERQEEVKAKTATEKPMRISIPTIDLSVPVLNPESAETSVLDGELTKGVVRYPGSGLLGEDSNMFVFGHSSYLPVVNNPAYKAFNGIQKLSEGDKIYVQGNESEFVYEVVSVRLVSADEALVEFKTGKAMLTLSTCNTFGAKEERFVVEAVLIDGN